MIGDIIDFLLVVLIGLPLLIITDHPLFRNKS